MICRTFALGEKNPYKYVVVLSFYRGKILLSRHKMRTTWETQGGHIEAGESAADAARRELYEESGAAVYEIVPVFDYWAMEESDGSSASGQVFFANIHKFDPLPESEMAEIGLFDTLPRELTYPDITPKLFARLAQIRQKGESYESL